MDGVGASLQAFKLAMTHITSCGTGSNVQLVLFMLLFTLFTASLFTHVEGSATYAVVGGGVCERGEQGPLHMSPVNRAGVVYETSPPQSL